MIRIDRDLILSKNEEIDQPSIQPKSKKRNRKEFEA